jgi:mercuric ion transport protein
VYDYPNLERGDLVTTNWKQGLLALPGIGVAMLPKLLCPLCWPLYSGIVSSIGLGFLIGTTYLLPITTAFLLLTLTVLGFRANQRRGYRPLLAGTVGSAAVVIGKFYLESNPAMYGGIGVLIIASVWNGWPRRVNQSACPSCAPDTTVRINGAPEGRL